MKRKILNFSLFAMIFVLLFCAWGCGSKENPKGEKAMVTIGEAFEIINANKNNKNFFIIDVRTADEYREMHIEGSINRPIMDKNAFIASIKDISKDAKILLHCRTQNRSKRAYGYMVEAGYKNVQYMKGGISDWASEGKPIKR